MIPRSLHEEIVGTIGEISAVEAVSGGCVSKAMRVECGGRPLFLKIDPAAAADFFAVEADALERLGAAEVDIHVPRVVAHGHSTAGGWLAMEWLENSRSLSEIASHLGTAVARLHRLRGGHWGWHRDGYIGPLRQGNRPAGSWAEFWFTQRLEPQLRLARNGGGIGTPSEWRQVESRLTDLLAPAEAEGPSLLHGDLWSGNVLGTADGPALVDPASYHGHREVDLAMADLFGGFGPGFFDAYEAEWPLAPGATARRAVYQLYYLLVHVNLFGATYLPATTRALGRVLAA